MLGTLHWWRKQQLWTAQIERAAEHQGIVRIDFANPTFYLTGSLNIKLSAATQETSGSISFDLDEPATYHAAVVGNLTRVPGLMLFKGKWINSDDPAEPWEISVEYMPEVTKIPLAEASIN